jgi:tyrosine-protein kinase Etk/Wzc
MSHSNHAAVKPGENTELDIASILDVLLDNRLMIALIATAFMVVGGLYAFLASPVYESNIMVQIEDNVDASAAKSLLGDVSSMFDIKSSADAEIQILGSRAVVSRTVDVLRLYVRARPHRFPVIGEGIARRHRGLSEPGLFGMGGYAWGDETIVVESLDVPSSLDRLPFQLVALKAGQYRLEGAGFDQPVTGRVGVAESFNSSAGPVRLLVREIRANPGTRFDLVRLSRMDTIEDLQKQLRISELGKQSGVIRATLQSTDPAMLTDTLNELGRQYVWQNVDRKAAQAESSLTFLEDQAPKMKRELEQAEDRYNQYRNTHTIIDLTEEAKTLLDRSSVAETRLISLKEKRQDLATRFGPAHPSIAAIDEQIRLTDGQIGELTGRIKRMPIDAQGALRLERDVRVNTGLYLAMRNNIEQLRLMKAGKIGSVRLVDIAAKPERPVLPRKALIIAASALFGLFVGAAAAFLREKLFVGITDIHALESHCGLAVHAAVPYSDEQGRLSTEALARNSAKGDHLLSIRSSNDPAIESLRSLRTALQFAMLEARNNVVLLTGPSPGIGKSFVSANLAAVLAEGKRVLLVDGDLRRGHLNKFLGANRGPGLADIITGAVSIDTAVRKTALINLDFIPTGTIPGNAAELFLRKAWSDFLLEVSSMYDAVIIDAPPVLAASDAAIMAADAGTILMVARFGQTRIGEVLESTKQLAHSGARVNGLVFNGIRSRSGRLAYGDKYGAYRYASYRYEKQ